VAELSECDYSAEVEIRRLKAKAKIKIDKQNEGAMISVLIGVFDYHRCRRHMLLGHRQIRPADSRLANLLKLLVVLVCLGAIVQPNGFVSRIDVVALFGNSWAPSKAKIQRLLFISRSPPQLYKPGRYWLYVSGSTRCTIAPRQTSTTSNLSRFASRLSVANLSMAQKHMAPTTMIIKTPIKTEIMAPSFCCRSLFRLRLQSSNLDFGRIIALAQFCHTGCTDTE